jgi:hypothetical protein
MASPAHRGHPVWNWVTLEVGAIAMAAVIAATAPLAGVDAFVHATLLRWAGASAPPDRVVAVIIPPGKASQSACGSLLEKALSAGRSRLALLLPPADELCRPPGRIDVGLLLLPAHFVRVDGAGRVLGFDATALPAAQLSELGFPPSSWVAPRQWRSVPALSLPDLVGGNVPPTVLDDRVVVVAMDDPYHLGDASDRTGPLSLQVAAAVSGALEDGPRHAAPAWLNALIGATAAALLGWFRRRKRQRLRLGVLGVAVVVVGASCLGALGLGLLLPLASLAASLAAFSGAVALPGFIAHRRANVGAAEILAKAPQLGAHSAYLLPDDEFWARLAHRVAQVHPAEGVLVAELPPFNWRLKVWPNGALNESIIKERRRDVRRTPFVDDAGARTTRVVEGFVVMPGVPTVICPLEAAGEVEGYLLLVGRSAADAFVARPTVTLGLGRELAELIRNRRLELFRAEQWRRPGGLFVDERGKASENLARSRAALEELELHSSLLRSASAGLLYTDAFGDVRIINQAAYQRLAKLGLTLGTVPKNGHLPPGVLPFVQVLDLLAGASGRSRAALVAQADHGFELEIPMPEERALIVETRRLEGEKAAGAVTTLVEVEQHVVQADAETVARLPEAGDPLTVFSLSELMAGIVDDIAEQARVRLRFQTPRVLGHVVAHKKQLTQAVTQFLLDIARNRTAAEAAVLTVRESLQRVDLTMVHLKLGVPSAAVASAALAPSVPPPGLDALARLVTAVEDSHGQVRVKSTEGWGLRLTASLVRARPRVQRAETGQVVHIADANREKKGDKTS